MIEPRPRVAELLRYMDEARSRLIAAVEGINPAFHSMRPRENAWSVAENLSHLAKVESGVARLVARSISWARDHRVPADTSDESILSSLDQFRTAEAATKLDAPETVSPAPDVPVEQSLRSLSESRERLKAALIEGSNMDLARVTRPHAVLGEINLYQWALFVAQHEERHRRQVDRAIAELTGRAAECAPIV